MRSKSLGYIPNDLKQFFHVTNTNVNLFWSDVIVTVAGAIA